VIRVEIRNFQSISHLELEFEGFATIVGRNFIGKSATLRAINAALTNKSGTDFIRWGESFCEVRITMGNYDILWHKENSNNFYEITVDGKKDRYEKIGKEEPPAPIKELGFSVIKLGTEKVNLNYAEQFFPLFLVDRQDTKGADLLTSVYGLDVLYKAVELCGKEQKSNKDDLRLRQKDLQFIEKDLERFDGFEEVLDRGKGIKESRKKLSDFNSTITKLRKLEDDVKRIYSECNKLKGISEINLPEIGIIPELIEDVTKLKSNFKSITRIKVDLEGLKGVEEINIPETPSVDDDINIISNLKGYLSKVKKLKADIGSFSGLEDLSIPRLDIDIEEIGTLIKKRDELKSLGSDLKDIDIEIKNIEEEYQKVEENLKSFDVCPLCGSENG
jgi:hypothetical protein